MFHIERRTTRRTDVEKTTQALLVFAAQNTIQYTRTEKIGKKNAPKLFLWAYYAVFSVHSGQGRF